jgi:hypothetical protein
MRCDIKDFGFSLTITTKPALRDRFFFYMNIVLLAAIIFLNARGFFDRWVGTSEFLGYKFPMTAGTALIIFLSILLAIGFVHNGFRTVIRIDKANKKLVVSKKWFNHTSNTWNVPFNAITDLSIKYDLPSLAEYDTLSNYRISDDGKIIVDSPEKRSIVLKPYYSLRIKTKNENRIMIRTAYYGRAMLEEISNLIKENLH